MKKNLVLTISLLLSLISVFYAKAENLIGQVVDEKGEPVPFVSVYVKQDPNIGTTTDENGRYAIDIDLNKHRSDELIFSFIGYGTEEQPIEGMSSDEILTIELEEQPILLEGAEVKAKISRRESKKIRRSVLSKFIKQLCVDFPKREAVYPIFSMFEGAQSDQELIHHEIIGEITEHGEKNRKGLDSVSLDVKKVKKYESEELEDGYEIFNEMADERINNPRAVRARKRQKRRNPDKIQPSYTVRTLDDQALRAHRFLWGGPTGSIINMLDTNRVKKWDYTMVGNDNVLTYTEKKNILGMVKIELQLHFYIDPSDYSVEKIVQTLEGELHIPFGYKLKDDELEFLNALQLGDEKFDRYRIRHAYVDVNRNVIITDKDGHKLIKEKNLEVNVDVISNKKIPLNYNAEAKVVVTGTPIVTE